MLPNGRMASRKPRWLAQAETDWLSRARKAIAEWDRLEVQLQSVADAQARGDILDWIGHADVIGTPAERYDAVRRDAEAGPRAYDQEIARRRVEQLEADTSDLSSRITGAIAAHGALPQRGGAPGATESGSATGAGTTMLIVAGGLALLGLVVFPLLWPD